MDLYDQFRAALQPPTQSPPIQADGHYSWLMTVAPSAGEVQLPVAYKKRFGVSVVVVYRRDFGLEGEHTADVAFPAGGGIGGGTVQLSNWDPFDSEFRIKQDQWILLCAGPHCHWYRVVAANLDDATGTWWVTLQGPDWDATNYPAAQAVLIGGVVGVYTTTVELDRAPVWTQ